jgi:hypothetical protein
MNKNDLFEFNRWGVRFEAFPLSKQLLDHCLQRPFATENRNNY